MSGKKGGKTRRKRPMTAYNFFFHEEHERIREKLQAEADAKEKEEYEKAKAENPDLPPRPKKKRKKISPRDELGFEALGKLIGKRWKEVSADELERLKELARQDAKRYRDEFEKSYQDQVGALLHGKSANLVTGVVEDEPPPAPVPIQAPDFAAGAVSSASSMTGYPNYVYNAAGLPSPFPSSYGAASAYGLPLSAFAGSFLPQQQQQQQLQLNLHNRLPQRPYSLPPGYNGSASLPWAGMSNNNNNSNSNNSNNSNHLSYSSSSSSMPSNNISYSSSSAGGGAIDAQQRRHEMLLAQAERTRELLIQQGARIDEGTRLRPPRQIARDSEETKSASNSKESFSESNNKSSS